MAADARWRVVRSTDDLPRLREQLGWAAQRQNQRFSEATPAGRLSTETRQKLILILAPVGLLAAAALYGLAERGDTHRLQNPASYVQFSIETSNHPRGGSAILAPMTQRARWRVVRSTDDLPRLREQLGWAVQRQNHRFSHATPAGRLTTETRQKLILIVSPVGLLAAAALYGLAPDDVRRHSVAFGALIAFFVAAFLAGLFLHRVRGWARRTAGGMIARRVARILRPIEARGPITIAYDLDDDRLSTSIPELGVQRVFSLRTAGLALAMPELVVLFRRKHSLHPLRTIHLPDPAERQAFLDTLTRLGVPIEELAGPVAGYE